jgi:hypothetical protein
MIRQKQTISALLGIALENAQAHVALVRRAGESFEVQKAFTFAFAEAPLAGNAEQLGAALHLALQQHGVKEHRCVVALPVQWVLSAQTQLPQIPEPDIPEFLGLEAERSFAYDPESLFVSSSRCRFPSGEQYATIAAIQREHVFKVQNLLQAARLKPLSITIGPGAVHKVFAQSASPELLLLVRGSNVEAAITCGAGLYAIRSIQAGDEALDVDGLSRELRVTLGQIPSEVRGRLINARLFGVPDSPGGIKSSLAPKLSALGLAIESSGAPSQGDPAAVAAAAQFLTGERPELEFLPPKISAWKQFAGKTSARKLAWAAGAVAALLLLLIAAFLCQGWQLSGLESRWAKISPRVTELEDMQQQIKKFRPWFDNSFHSLTILRKLTEAFPVDGVVTAKTLEIRNQQVTCSGVARDNQALFKMLDQLRGTKEVADVKMDQIRGKSPLQFNFNYRWVEGGTGER